MKRSFKSKAKKVIVIAIKTRALLLSANKLTCALPSLSELFSMIFGDWKQLTKKVLVWLTLRLVAFKSASTSVLCRALLSCLFSVIELKFARLTPCVNLTFPCSKQGSVVRMVVEWPESGEVETGEMSCTMRSWLVIISRLVGIEHRVLPLWRRCCTGRWMKGDDDLTRRLWLRWGNLRNERWCGAKPWRVISI